MLGLGIKRKIKFFIKVNWIKTLYFNFKMFPFKIAKKLPVFFYGSVKFTCLKGSIEFAADIKTAMIGFGQPYEMKTRHRGIAEFFLKGNILFKGHVQFGKDFFVYVNEGGRLEMSHMSSIASLSKIICTNTIIFGKWARIGSESQVIDTTFHTMKNTKTGEVYPKDNPIIIGNYNYIGNRVSIMAKTRTNSYCTVASNSLCNKDYWDLGENILIGGIPAKLIKEHVSRDWEGEEAVLEKYLTVRI